MQGHLFTTRLIKSLQFVSSVFLTGNIYSQGLAQTDKAVMPGIITQSYLDSTRPLSKGNNKLNAAYLGLVYNFRDIDSVEWIYAEVKVPKGEAPVKTYYCAIQGYIFYCGIQANSKEERRIIFSVWDSKWGNKNKNEVPE